MRAPRPNLHGFVPLLILILLISLVGAGQSLALASAPAQQNTPWPTNTATANGQTPTATSDDETPTATSTDTWPTDDASPSPTYEWPTDIPDSGGEEGTPTDDTWPTDDAWPTDTAEPSLPTGTPTPTLLPSERPDACEPNDDLGTPCALPTETEIVDLTFVDDQLDVYSFLLKGPRVYRITAAGDGTIDPTVSVYLAGKPDSPVSVNDDAQPGSLSATAVVTTTGDAWYLVQVENRSPGVMRGQTYRISARSEAVPATPEPDDTTRVVDTVNRPDLLENNYSDATAARIVWAVPYDLNFVCPDPSRPPAEACPAGDHDFFVTYTKAGVPFTAMTESLENGADTVLTAYRRDPAQQSGDQGNIPGWQIVEANDDIAAGWTLRSMVSFTPDWSGDLLLVVAPAQRTNLPGIPGPGFGSNESTTPARYRLIVGSPDLPAVRDAIASQSDLPPTPTIQPSPEPAPDTGGEGGYEPPLEPTLGAPEQCSTGAATVRASDGTGLYLGAPPGSNDLILTYPEGTEVQLQGLCYRGWVKAQPLDSVVPGWMWGPDLRPAGGFSEPMGESQAAEEPTLEPTLEPLPPTPPPSVEDLGLAPTPAPAPAQVEARVVSVNVCVQAQDDRWSCAAPRAGVLVRLLHTATRQELQRARTDIEGRVTLSVSVPAGTQVILELPTLGIRQVVELESNDEPLLIRLPAALEGERP